MGNTSLLKKKKPTVKHSPTHTNLLFPLFSATKKLLLKKKKDSKQCWLMLLLYTYITIKYVSDLALEESLKWKNVKSWRQQWKTLTNNTPMQNRVIRNHRLKGIANQQIKFWFGTRKTRRIFIWKVTMDISVGKKHFASHNVASSCPKSFGPLLYKFYFIIMKRENQSLKL